LFFKGERFPEGIISEQFAQGFLKLKKITADNIQIKRIYQFF